MGDPVIMAGIAIFVFLLFTYVYQINYRKDVYGVDKIGGLRGDIGTITYIPSAELERFTNYMKYNCSPDKTLDDLASDFLTKNKSDPSCCPSTFSNSDGCICLDEKQKDFLNKRGNNRTGYSYY